MVYFSAYGIVFGAVFLLAIFITFEIVPKLLKNDKNKVNDLQMAIGFLIVLLTPYISYFTLAIFFGFYPTVPSLKTTSLSEELEQLEQRAETIASRFSTPKNMTLYELEEALAETLEFTQDLAPIISKQNEEIERLSAEVSAERERAEEARKLAADIQSLTKAQIASVKLLITEDARESSQESFLMGLIFSLPIGIVGSLVASWIHPKILPRGSQRTQN